MEALKRMRSPIIDEMTRLMEPISPVYANRAMRNHWRHYERWNERLDGFIAIGDAFCHYNPVYAQGMTALALSATMLRACLEKYAATAPEFAREFFDAEARIQHDPWKLSAGVDLRFPFTLGERPFSMKLFNLYLDGIGLAAKDPIVRRRSGRSCTAHPPALRSFRASRGRTRWRRGRGQCGSSTGRICRAS